MADLRYLHSTHAHAGASRVCHVRAYDGGWIVDLRTLGGPVIVGADGLPFCAYAEALDAERRWLSETWGL